MGDLPHGSKTNGPANTCFEVHSARQKSSFGHDNTAAKHPCVGIRERYLHVRMYVSDTGSEGLNSVKPVPSLDGLVRMRLGSLVLEFKLTFPHSHFHDLCCTVTHKLTKFRYSSASNSHTLAEKAHHCIETFSIQCRSTLTTASHRVSESSCG